MVFAALAFVVMPLDGPARATAHLDHMAHVFNYPFPDIDGNPGNVNDMASDLDFYSFGGREFAVVGSYDRGAFIFDITNPELPTFVSQVVCPQRQNDPQVKVFGNRVVLVLAKDGSGRPCITERVLGNTTPPGPVGGLAVFDITTPASPVRMYSYVYSLVVPLGSSPGLRGGAAHNFTWHPTQPVGWISTGDLPGTVNRIPILDFSDVDNPVLVRQITVEGGPHDIAFNASGTRAYVAAENNGLVFDSTDPRNPTLLSATTGPATYVHGLDPSPDGARLVLTDESLVLGGFFHDETAVCPGGGLTFYDIAGDNERHPVPRSYFVADVQGTSPDHRACTAHMGEISANSQVMTVGWYLGGVRVVDLSDPLLPREIGHAVMPGAEVWAAKLHQGPYVYASDLGRGFDVFRWEGTQAFDD